MYGLSMPVDMWGRILHLYEMRVTTAAAVAVVVVNAVYIGWHILALCYTLYMKLMYILWPCK